MTPTPRARLHTLALVTGLLTLLAGVVVTRVTTDAAGDRSTVVVASLPAPPGGEPDRAPVSAGAGAPRGSAQPLAPLPPADGRDAPDPVIVHAGDRWALFTTQVGYLSMPVAMSDDLREWSKPADALPQLPVWAAWGSTWAPGVLSRGDGYVLYFAAQSRDLGLQCIGAATAPVIEGPYTSPSPEPLVCQPELGGSIDPQPFVDRDGTAYLLWKADANAIGRTSELFAQRLRADGLALEGEAVALLRRDADWEWPLIENPAMVQAGGRYVLLYSGGWWESGGYATGYAVCDTPLGPCTKITTAQPMLASRQDEAGTGGASVVTGSTGDYWLAYHAWTSGAVGYGNGGRRSLRFAPLAVTDRVVVGDPA